MLMEIAIADINTNTGSTVIRAFVKHKTPSCGYEEMPLDRACNNKDIPVSFSGNPNIAYPFPDAKKGRVLSRVYDVGDGTMLRFFIQYNAMVGRMDRGLPTPISRLLFVSKDAPITDMNIELIGADGGTVQTATITGRFFVLIRDQVMDLHRKLSIVTDTDRVNYYNNTEYDDMITINVKGSTGPKFEQLNSRVSLSSNEAVKGKPVRRILRKKRSK